jgi:hypothetical protein
MCLLDDGKFSVIGIHAGGCVFLRFWLIAAPEASVHGQFSHAKSSFGAGCEIA